MSNRAEPLLDRLMRQRAVDERGCWLWSGRRNLGGYGTICIGSRSDGSRRTTTVHRVSFELHVRVLNEGEWVLHHCDTPACFNPAHLYAGNRTDNIRDMVVRGGRKGIAASRGETHSQAKLTEADVIAIRESDKPQAVLAERYGLSRVSICDIQLGRTWKHLPGVRYTDNRRRTDEPTYKRDPLIKSGRTRQQSLPSILRKQA